jgi:hypothetical protein
MFIKNLIPEPEHPLKIKDYVFRLLYNHAEHRTEEIRFYLKSLERSILTQDLDSKDLRRKVLRKFSQPLSLQFSKTFDGLLKVFCKIEDNLKKGIYRMENFVLLKKVNKSSLESYLSYLMNRLQIQAEIHESLWNLINEYTFDNIENIDLEMK